MKYKFSNLSEQYDLVFVIPEDAKGWILEAICREIERYFKGRTFYASDLYNLPLARAYFFAHYSFFPSCIKANPFLYGKRTLLFHSHPKDLGLKDGEFNYAFNKATKLICMNSLFAKKLVKEGLKNTRVTYELCGADPAFFRSHSRGSGAIGFSTAYYERKNPDRIINIIRAMPHRQFILLGKNWHKYIYYNELLSLSNLTYLDNLAYSQYPSWYDKIDVFVSPATLEGGPIPLIEAMMSNAVPVASKTGFSQDIIQHGMNGFLFEADAKEDVIINLIEMAYEMTTDVRQTVAHLTWERYSKGVQQFI